MLEKLAPIALVCVIAGCSINPGRIEEQLGACEIWLVPIDDAQSWSLAGRTSSLAVDISPDQRGDFHSTLGSLDLTWSAERLQLEIIDVDSGTAVVRRSPVRLCAAALDPDSGCLILAERGGDGEAAKLECRDAATGGLVWTHDLPHDSASIVADGGRVYACAFGSASDDLAVSCLELETGELVWEQRRTGLQTFGRNFATRASVHLMRDHVAVLADHPGMRILRTYDRENGHNAETILGVERGGRPRFDSRARP